MNIPFSYSLRNLWTRKMTTILTVSGMALVVYVFAAVLMLSAGLAKNLTRYGILSKCDRRSPLGRCRGNEHPGTPGSGHY